MKPVDAAHSAWLSGDVRYDMYSQAAACLAGVRAEMYRPEPPIRTPPSGVRPGTGATSGLIPAYWPELSTWMIVPRVPDESMVIPTLRAPTSSRLSMPVPSDWVVRA